jgi:hypothetical protein
MGNQAWCFMTTPTHMECFYNLEGDCLKRLVLAKPSDDKVFPVCTPNISGSIDQFSPPEPSEKDFNFKPSHSNDL